MKAFQLKTEQLVNPIGLDVSNPTFTWQCPIGHMQAAYQVQVLSGDKLVWDSGKQESGDMQITYPQELCTKTIYQWKIKLWDENGEEGEWSDTASFETGIAKDEWKAKWISPEQTTEPEKRKPAGYLRKQFVTEQFVADQKASARLYCTAHGLYAVYINGKRVGLDMFTPGSDEYKKRLTYQVYDISDLLEEGTNEIQVVLGDGWYRGCNGIDGIRNLFGEDLSFLAQMESDGEVLLTTDETWEGSQSGPIRLTDMELGEIYDARLENIKEWNPVTTLEFGLENLVASNCVPVREKETFAGKLIQTPNGEHIYDFGQNLAGYTQLRVNAQAGQTIKLVHGEVLDENGNFTIANFQPGDRNQSGGIKQEILYICKDGKNTYKPAFSIFGFRYAKVESEIPAEKIQLTAHAVYSDMEETAEFVCGKQEVNQLFSNSIWSMKSNFCDVPTDCPTRERAGWTGDAGVFTPTGSRLMNCYPVLRKWLANVRINQHADGKMAYISPTNGKGSQISEMFSASVGWGDASVLVPYALYENFGNRKILEENYSMMTKWVDFLCDRAKASRENDPFEGNPYQDYIINTGMDYGEWCEPGANVMAVMQNAFANGQPEVATAYFAKSAKLLGEIAGILGRTEDQKKYEGIAENVTQAYRSICVKDGHIQSKRQCEYVRPLAFELLEEADAKRAAEDLNALVAENHYHLNTGFLSTPYLCEVLTRYGYEDTAYRLLLQEECPSWLYEVKKGATTIWETWDGVREDGTVHDSLNHYSYGAVSGWLLSGVCGIHYSHDTLTIQPVPTAALGYAKAVYESPRGRIVSSWKMDCATGEVTYHFEIPGNVEAEIILADGTTRRVASGEYDY